MHQEKTSSLLRCVFQLLTKLGTSVGEGIPSKLPSIGYPKNRFFFQLHLPGS